MAQRVVVGVDGSDASARALRWAADEARLRDVELEVVYAFAYTPSWHVYAYSEIGMDPRLPPPDPEEEERVATERAQQLLERMLAGVATDGLTVRPRAVHDRRPARALVQAARGADLLVVGSRGRGGFVELLLGSVSHQCALHAPCPVVIVGGREDDADTP